MTSEHAKLAFPGLIKIDSVQDLNFRLGAKLYIPSTPNNSNETHTFMCLGRAGHFGQH